jgi:hypothetical protein
MRIACPALFTPWRQIEILGVILGGELGIFRD